MHGQCWSVLPAFGNRRINAAMAKNMHNRSLAVLLPTMKHENSKTCRGLPRRKTGCETNVLMDNEFAVISRELRAIEH